MPATTRVLADRERQGRRRQVVGHGQPGGRARGARAHGRRARRRHLGLQRPAHARRRRPPRRCRRQDPSQHRGSAEPARSRRSARAAQGRVDGVPRRRREHGADVARARSSRRPSSSSSPTCGGARWTTCSIDMPPGTGDIQMGLARMLPQAEMLVVTTPALAAQKVAVRVADMARRSFMKVAGVVENMTRLRRARRRALRTLRRGWRGRTGVRDRCAPGGPDTRSSPQCRPAATPDAPSRSPTPDSPAGRRVPRARRARRRRAVAAHRDERVHRADLRARVRQPGCRRRREGGRCLIDPNRIRRPSRPTSRSCP